MNVSEARQQFASLMARARSRPLTLTEKKRLQQVSQAIRYSRRTTAKNPPRTLIYGQVLEVICKRTGSHRCDAKCRAVGHRYRHVFRSKPRMYGNPDGSVTIR